MIAYEAAVVEIYSLKALQASPAFAAYEVEGDELAADMSSFAMANAIYAALVEGHAAEVRPPLPSPSRFAGKGESLRKGKRYRLDETLWRTRRRTRKR